jgi:hypothetical protein
LEVCGLGRGDRDAVLFARDDLLTLVILLSAIASISSLDIISRAARAIIAKASRS